MPTQRDISKLSIKQLAWIARCSAETAAKRLRDAHLDPVSEDGRATYYDPRDALPVLYEIGQGLNPKAESARVDRATAELRELELKVKLGELVPGSDQDQVVIALATTTAARLRGIPVRVAPEVAMETDVARCKGIVETAIDEALHDLAEEGDRAAKRAKAAA